VVSRGLRLVPIALAVLVFAPIVGNYFMGDDFLHLYHLANLPLLQNLIEPFGGHLYLVRNAVFALLRHFADTEPRWFFAAMLATHVVNVWLLYDVILVFGGSARLACAGAALWGTAPVLAGTLELYSAHGIALVATCLLVVIRQLGRLTGARQLPSAGRVALWYLLLLAGATCYGTGIAVALVFPLIAWLLLPSIAGRGAVVIALASMWIVVPLLYVGDHRLWIDVYGGEPVTLPLVFAQLRTPRGPAEMLLGLLGHGVTAAHLGFLWPRGDAPPAIWWGVIGAFAVGIVVVLVAGHATHRRATLAWLLIAAATYAFIAAGRGNLYRLLGPTATPVTIAETPRYHYLGPLAFVVVTCLVASAAAERIRMPSRAKDVLLGTVLAGIVIAHGHSDWRMNDWATERRQTGEVLAAIGRAVRAQPRGADVAIRNRDFPPAGPLLTSRLFPGWAGAFIVFFPDDTVEGRRVHFTTSDEEALAGARKGRRSATLLVREEGPTAASRGGTPPPARASGAAHP